MAQGAAVTVACAATRQILFKNPQVYITGLKQNCLGKVVKILKGNLDLIIPNGCLDAYEVKVNIDIFKYQEKVKLISQFQRFFSFFDGLLEFASLP